MSLKGRTIFISGGSRGIGLAIAVKAAGDGANVAIAATTIESHRKLPGTIYTAAAEIEKAGGRALAIPCDVRDAAQVKAAIAKTVEKFGGLDVCINNASAIALTDTSRTSVHRYDLMNSVNTRGTFICSKYAIPHLKESSNPHILNMSPPLCLDPKWFARHTAYTISKYGMSMCTLGMAEELRPLGIAVNSLWPLTTIDTSAIRFAVGGEEMAQMSRSPMIVADAAHDILSRPSRSCTGNFFIDEEIVRANGDWDISKYSCGEHHELVADIFIPQDVVERSTTQLKHYY